MVPRASLAPASPMKAPEIAMVAAVTLPTEMPAVRAASGFAPTARSWKPSVERSMSHQKTQTARSAITIPPCSLKGAGSRRVNAAVSATLGVCGWFDPATCHAFWERM